jgi:hypothetical protein
MNRIPSLLFGVCDGSLLGVGPLSIVVHLLPMLLLTNKTPSPFFEFMMVLFSCWSFSWRYSFPPGVAFDELNSLPFLEFVMVLF